MKLAFAVLALAHVTHAEEATEDEVAADVETAEGEEKGPKEIGIEHLAEKEKEEGVVKLESGLLYKVLEKGEGIHAPKAGSKCNVTYAGRLIDGTQFDAGTTEFAPNQVIKGWTEAMQYVFFLYVSILFAFAEQKPSSQTWKCCGDCFQGASRRTRNHSDQTRIKNPGQDDSGLR